MTPARYENIFCKNGTVQRCYRKVVHLILQELKYQPKLTVIDLRNLVRHDYGIGTNQTDLYNAVALCHHAGLTYKTTNEAPRGGKCGTVLHITVDHRLKFFRDIDSGRIVDTPW